MSRSWVQAEERADVRGRGGEYQEREKLGVVKGGGGVKVVALAVAVAEAETGEEQDEEGEQLRAGRYRMKAGERADVVVMMVL